MIYTICFVRDAVKEKVRKLFGCDGCDDRAEFQTKCRGFSTDLIKRV